MTSFALVTFDITGASSSDYAAISEGLAALGLTRTVIGESNKPSELPQNTFAGQFSNLVSSAELRNSLCDSVTAVIRRQGRRSEVFVIVAPDNWAWGVRLVT